MNFRELKTVVRNADTTTLMMAKTAQTPPPLPRRRTTDRSVEPTGLDLRLTVAFVVVAVVSVAFGALIAVYR